MSRATQLSSFIKSATSRLSPRVRHLSLSALQSSAYQQGGFRAQYGGAPTTSSAANIFSDWSQEPTAQTLVPFVVEQSVSFVCSYHNPPSNCHEQRIVKDPFFRSAHLLTPNDNYLIGSR